MPTSVEVWWGRPADARPRHDQVLDDVERSRAVAYVREVDRNRFVVAAVLLRCAIARRTGLAPERVTTDRSCSRCGKPHGPVRSPDAALSLSVAHAGDAVVVAVASTGALGVDVEPVEHSAVTRQVAQGSLTAYELAHLDGLSDAEFTRPFLQRWVAKEAILKASGHGLRLPMAGIELDGSEPPFRVRAWAEQPGLAQRLTLHRLRAAPAGHVASLAVLRGPEDVVVEEERGADLLATFGLA